MTLINQKDLIIGYFFSVTHPFDKIKEKILFFWANMDYVQLYISLFKKMVALKSPGGVNFTFVTILNVSGYSNEGQ